MCEAAAGMVTGMGVGRLCGSHSYLGSRLQGSYVETPGTLCSRSRDTPNALSQCPFRPHSCESRTQPSHAHKYESSPLVILQVSGAYQARNVAAVHAQSTCAKFSLTLHRLAKTPCQVLALPPGARLLASNAHCPIAAYAIGQQVLCIQAHPEFEPEYSAFLLGKRRQAHGDALYQETLANLPGTHDGPRMARLMLDFMGAT